MAELNDTTHNEQTALILARLERIERELEVVKEQDRKNNADLMATREDFLTAIHKMREDFLVANHETRETFLNKLNAQTKWFVGIGVAVGLTLIATIVGAGVTIVVNVLD